MEALNEYGSGNNLFVRPLTIPENPDHGEPETFTARGLSSVTRHHRRCLLFNGDCHVQNIQRAAANRSRMTGGKFQRAHPNGVPGHLSVDQ